MIDRLESAGAFAPQLALSFAMLVAIAGCTAHYPINQRVADVPEASDSYTIATRRVGGRSNDLMLLLAFSGGGTRAAAFSYGVLKTLADTPIRVEGREGNLLQEVDVISSVSGGSFTAAYYGLFGKRIFEDFEDKFLLQRHEGPLLGRTLSPGSWPSLASARYGRSELAAEYFDKQLFEGKTYEDMLLPDRPQIMINATDITNGAQFSFHQETFNAMCSDLLSFPVSRAVVASTAIPVVFTPVVVRNYAGTCKYPMPQRITDALEAQDTDRRIFQLALMERELFDSQSKPYFHLLDGGLADLLGVRPLIDDYVMHGSFYDLLVRAGRGNIEHLAIIIVNAEAEPGLEGADSDAHLSARTVIEVASNVPLYRYSYETVDAVRRHLEAWQREVRERRCEGASVASTDICNQFKIYLVEVKFREHVDDQERQYLLNLPTDYSLPEGSVERIKKAARELLHGSPEFQRLLNNLN